MSSISPRVNILERLKALEKEADTYSDDKSNTMENYSYYMGKEEAFAEAQQIVIEEYDKLLALLDEAMKKYKK